jgi:phosphate starvation-inducible PhoH-like protein
MKMFLTRLGASSKAVITGDITQTDLAPGEASGLKHAWQVLPGIKGIDFVELTRRDIVRHRLVQEIVDAYQNETQGAEQA